LLVRWKCWSVIPFFSIRPLLTILKTTSYILFQSFLCSLKTSINTSVYTNGSLKFHSSVSVTVLSCNCGLHLIWAGEEGGEGSSDGGGNCDPDNKRVPFNLCAIFIVLVILILLRQCTFFTD
jgi:hypothetical protein